MSQDDPDLAPREWSKTENTAASAAAVSPPRLPDFPGTLPAKIECTEAERAQVQAWDLDSVQAMHAWCQERMEMVIRATPEACLCGGLPGTISQGGSRALCVLLSGGRMDCCEEEEGQEGFPKRRKEEGRESHQKGVVQR